MSVYVYVYMHHSIHAYVTMQYIMQQYVCVFTCLVHGYFLETLLVTEISVFMQPCLTERERERNAERGPHLPESI